MWPWIIRGILAIGGATGFVAFAYKSGEGIGQAPAKVLKDNAVPLAVVAAATFLAFRAMQKAKVA